MFCYEIIAVWIQFYTITFRKNDVTEYCFPRLGKMSYVSKHKTKTYRDINNCTQRHVVPKKFIAWQWYGMFRDHRTKLYNIVYV